MKTRMLQVWQYLLFATLACGLLPGQMTTTGAITGDVMDSSGHAIAGAKERAAIGQGGDAS